MVIEFIAETSPETLDLGEPAAKPTALASSVVEAARSVWSAPGTDVGLWECSPGSFTARRDGYTEICQILSGSVVVETTDGARATLGPGTTLVMPSGWEGTWHVLETVRKGLHHDRRLTHLSADADAAAGSGVVSGDAGTGRSCRRAHGDGSARLTYQSPSRRAL